MDHRHLARYVFRVGEVGLAIVIGWSMAACSRSENLTSVPPPSWARASFPDPLTTTTRTVAGGASADLEKSRSYTQTEIQNAERVSFCELMRNPGRFEDRLVRVAGRFVAGFEWSYWYDPRCPDARTWVAFDSKATQNSRQEALAVLDRERDRLTRRDAAAAPAVVFSQLVIDLEIVARFESAALRYGHLGGWSSEFRVLSVDRAVVPSESQRP